MRNAILGSGAVHLALIAALAWARATTTIVMPGPDAVQVALVDPVATPVQPPPPTEAPREEPKLTEVKPVEDTGVKLKPDPPRKKKKPEPPRDEPPPANPPPGPTLPSAQVGSAGLRGDISVDASNFEFTYYLVLVRNRIAANWSPPAGLAATGRRVRAVVQFRIGRDGRLSGVRMEELSGMEFFDRSAFRAVQLSDRMPPLPDDFPAGELGVHFGFDWEAP